MNLHRAADKVRDVSDAYRRLERSHRILTQMIEAPTTDESLETHLVLTLQQSKRVRRDTTLLTRALAAAIDATAQEAQAND